MKDLGHGEFETTFTMGPARKGQFQITRNGSSRHVLYPACSRELALDAKMTPLCGPDAGGVDRKSGERICFEFVGKMYETFKIKLTHTSDGGFSLEVADRGGNIVNRWAGWERWARETTEVFFASGTFNGGGLTPFSRSRGDDNPLGVLFCNIDLDADGVAYMQIPVNSRAAIAVPGTNGEFVLRSGGSEDLPAWCITGEPRSSQKVRLDLRRQTVTWEPVELAIGY